MTGWMRCLPDGKPISALGFGCSSLWAKPDFAEKRAQEILDVAAGEGINHFDTAPSYGKGLAEERLGRFLIGRRADEFVISTKIGSNLVDGEVVRGFDRNLVTRSFEQSLLRLGVERVDVLYLHGPEVSQLTDELLRFLEDEKTRGRIGFSGMESPDLSSFATFAGLPIDIAMLHYNAVDPSADRLIEELTGRGKIIISGTSLAQGKFDWSTFLPTSKARTWYLLRMLKNDPLFWSRGPAVARRLATLRDNAHAAAIAFVTGHPLVTSGLFGSSNAQHVAANARAGHHPLTEAERDAILNQKAGPMPFQSTE